MIKLVISDTLSFMNKDPIITIDNAPGGCFSIIEDNNKLFMLCGTHGSDKKDDEIPVPDLVWPKEKRTLINWKVKRNDRKNGMYLLSSNDGTVWEEKSEYPVLHGFVSSDSCRLGEVCFDTSPYLIKYDKQFFFYGRLNSSLDERRICVRRSNDLVNWTLPEKINIVNENDNSFKKNYYNPVVFSCNEELYMLTPYFEACGTTKRVGQNASTLLLKSADGISWNVINSFLPHDGKYKNRVNDARIEGGNVFAFYRDNIWENSDFFVSYSFPLDILV